MSKVIDSYLEIISRFQSLPAIWQNEVLNDLATVAGHKKAPSLLPAITLKDPPRERVKALSQNGKKSRKRKYAEPSPWPPGRGKSVWSSVGLDTEDPSLLIDYRKWCESNQLKYVFTRDQLARFSGYILR